MQILYGAMKGGSLRMISQKIPVFEAHAFCATCPTEQEVTALLNQLGFQLVFQLEATHPAKSSAVAPLPAQYHYARPEEGIEVIFLAGKDKPEAGQSFPHHASRFWIYAGTNLLFSQHVIQMLSGCWPLCWHNLPRWMVLPPKDSLCQAFSRRI